MSGTSASRPDADADSGLLSSDGLQELRFVLGTLAGISLFAFGLAFFILAVSTPASPPAPYFASTTDRLIVFGISLGGMIVGGVVVWRSARAAGW